MSNAAKGKNNQILRSIRYLLDLPDGTVGRWINSQGLVASPDDVAGWLCRDVEDGFKQCPDEALSAFLNALIEERRGQRDPRMPVEPTIDNNAVLRKLRIAFTLKDHDIVAILAGSGKQYSKAQINALFQKPTHKNFQRCGDQVLRHFLTGLTRRYRPETNAPSHKNTDQKDVGRIDSEEAAERIAAGSEAQMPAVAAEGSPWQTVKPRRPKRKR